MLSRIVKSFTQSVTKLGQIIIDNARPLYVMALATIGITSRLVKLGVSPGLAIPAGIVTITALCA